MERIRSLNGYQKGVLLLTVVMVLAFTAAYFVITARVGFMYKDTILLPEKENGTTVYSGEIHGIRVSFRVSPDKTVEFQYGEKRYGPYTAKEDPSAIPEGRERLTGIELCKGEDILFRGGVSRSDDSFWLYNEDGIFQDGMEENRLVDVSVMNSYGTIENVKVMDPVEPSVSTILKLMAGPKLTHKGQWSLWLLGVFVCIGTAASILFAEELFQLGLGLWIRDSYGAEPSGWVRMRRYISWTILPILAMILFIVGLL